MYINIYIYVPQIISYDNHVCNLPFMTSLQKLILEFWRFKFDFLDFFTDLKRLDSSLLTCTKQPMVGGHSFGIHEFTQAKQTPDKHH